MDILKVDNLSVAFPSRYGDIRAVRNVSFSVKEGETLAIAGESGCGKSVTAKAVMRLLEFSNVKISEDSSIVFDGDDLLKLKKRELNRIRGSQMAMVFQDAASSLDPTMTVGKQIIEMLRIHRQIGKQEALKRAEELLQLVELPDPPLQLKKYPFEMSGGMRQRVMIAMALANEPKLLIADEPTTALDVTIQAQILELLQRLQKQMNMSVIIITHDLGVVSGIADRVLIMYGGMIVEEGYVRDVFKSPKHPYTKALLDSVPKNSIQKQAELTALDGTPPDLRSNFNYCPFAPRCKSSMRICKRRMPELQNDVRCWLNYTQDVMKDG